MKYGLAATVLAFALAGCGEAAPPSEDDGAAAEEAALGTAPAGPAEDATAEAAGAPEGAEGRAILSGPVSSLSLDVDPVMVVMAPDGAEREAFLELAPEAAETLSATFEGVGSTVAFDCALGGPFTGDDGATYDTFTDCRLAP